MQILKIFFARVVKYDIIKNFAAFSSGFFFSEKKIKNMNVYSKMT